jgi:hypothetical protein
MVLRRLLDELEKIKTRVINMGVNLLNSERASKKEIKRVKMALKEYKEGKTIPLTKFYL